MFFITCPIWCPSPASQSFLGCIRIHWPSFAHR